jgi:hypothetical protein
MLSQNIDDPSISLTIRSDVGNIRQPWVDLGSKCGVSEFSAKALFALGMLRRYILSANTVLMAMRFHGFVAAYSLLSSGIELLGKCVHANKEVRQQPVAKSSERLLAGLDYLKNQRLGIGIIVETNHYPQATGGYTGEDLKQLRHLVVHGACIARTANIKADIELLHQLRKLYYGVPIGENEPHEGAGPIKGALDRYYDGLTNGDRDRCDRLASAAISPLPTQFQKGAWPFDAQVVNEIKQHIQENLALGYFPISGGHTKAQDYFQLYP